MLASSRRSWRGDASRQVGRAASLRLETEHENTEESTGNSGQNRSFAFSSQAFQVFLTLQVECFILRRDDILFQLNSGCNSKLCCTTILVVTAHTLCRLCPGIVQCLPTVKMKNSQSLNVTGGIQLLFFVCVIFSFLLKSTILMYFLFFLSALSLTCILWRAHAAHRAPCCQRSTAIKSKFFSILVCYVAVQFFTAWLLQASS